MHRGFSFKASNNAAEYEVLIASLRLAKEVGAQEIMVYSNSSLVVTGFRVAMKTKILLWLSAWPRHRSWGQGFLKFQLRQGRYKIK